MEINKTCAELKGFKRNSPRDAFKSGFKIELIKEEFEQDFIDMIDKRNATTHTYNEETAIEIYDFIVNKALPAFKSVNKRIKNIYKKINASDFRSIATFPAYF
ncbi:MAG: nucleotidyltransferase substrate binding protein [Desulfobacterales bacterium]|nr:nucleotidyltransferase substrate binding protein [Desulfobacterales bacterium]